VDQICSVSFVTILCEKNWPPRPIRRLHESQRPIAALSPKLILEHAGHEIEQDGLILIIALFREIQPAEMPEFVAEKGLPLFNRRVARNDHFSGSWSHLRPKLAALIIVNLFPRNMHRIHVYATLKSHAARGSKLRPELLIAFHLSPSFV
jgi:hypothetical protein